MSQAAPTRSVEPEFGPKLDLPFELIPRAFELLRRGGVTAVVVSLVAVCPAVPILAALLPAPAGFDSGPVVLLVGMFAFAALHAGSLAAFGASVSRRPWTRDALTRAVQLMPHVLLPATLDFLIDGMIGGLGAGAVTAALSSWPQPEVVLPLGAIGVLLLATASMIHGGLVVGVAQIALTRPQVQGSRVGLVEAVATGALPFFAVAIVAGANLGPSRGVWTVPGELLLVVSVLALLVAHFVSCAVAVAIASHGESVE